MTLQRTFWLALIALLMWSLLMNWEAGEFQRPECPQHSLVAGIACKLDSPIADLELARNPAEFNSLIDQGDAEQNELWNVEIARVNTCMDFLFIALYWAVFVLFARFLGGWPSALVIAFVSLAAVFDFAENFRLLHALQGIGAGRGEFPVPASVSAAKWGLFATAVLFLSITLALKRQFWPLLMSIALFGSAVLTVVGVFHPAWLGTAVLVLAAALFVAIFYYSPFRPFGRVKLLMWIEFAYLVRFQLIGALLLSMILPAGYFAMPSLFVGLFDAMRFWSFTFIVAAALHLAFTVMITTRLVYVYGLERFSGIATLPPAADLTWRTTVWFAGLAAPCIVMACCGTALGWFYELAGIIIGVVFAIIPLWITAKVQNWIEPPLHSSARAIYPFRFASKDAPAGASAPPAGGPRGGRFVPGQTHPGLQDATGRTHSGHKTATAALLVSAVLYVGIGLSYQPKLASAGVVENMSAAPASAEPSRDVIPHLDKAHPPAALFYLLFLLTIFVLFFSGAAFTVDKIRLPVLTTTLALSFLGGIAGTDHLFAVKTKEKPTDRPVSPFDAVKNWEIGRGQSDPKKPMVIVATAGGGIRAASWTSQVLTGLTERCKISEQENVFSSSLLVISSVSGGSVGSLFLVGSYDSSGRLATNQLSKIRENSARTSLSAVGWGLLYPDVLRTIPGLGPLLAPQDVDRGWALETQWLANWDGRLWRDPPTMADWSKDVLAGKRLVTIFNATAVESGQRFLISTTTMGPPDAGVIQFAADEPYSQFNVPVSTAARLSATFPWVSPNPRAWDWDRNEKIGVHLADGGYYDNSGILSASQWLLQAVDAIQEHPVIFIVIDSEQGSPAKGKAWSWQRQAAGPIETLLTVRDSSQVSRAEYELDLVLDRLSRKMRIKPYRVLYPSDPLTPLSWHLTREQEKRIEKAWQDPHVKTEVNAIAGELNCSAK